MVTRPPQPSAIEALRRHLQSSQSMMAQNPVPVQPVAQAEPDWQDSEDFKDAVLNSVTAEIAVINRSGVILAVNARWQQFACNNSVQPGQPAANTGVGSNYLTVCSIEAATDPHTREACQGIVDVLEGHRPIFTLEYPCHSPQQKRWFNMVVTPLRYRGQDGATITHTDITPVKQLQEDMLESFLAIQSILDTTLDGFWRTDLQGRLLEVNPSYCRMSGYTAAELLAMRISDLEALENPADTAARMARLTQHGHDQFETRHRRKDGTVWPVEISTTFNGKLSPPCCFVFVRDITERVQLQESILQSEHQRFEQLNKLTASVPGVVYQFRVQQNGDWSFDYLSAGVESLLELTPQEVYRDASAPTQCIVEEDRASHRAAVEQSLKTLSPWSHEHRIQTRSGRLKWVHGQALPEPQADGSVICYGILTDITANRNAQIEIQQRETYLQAIFDTALDAVVGMDEQGLVTAWNRRAEVIFGWCKAEAIGKPLHDMIVPTQHRAGHAHGLARFLATGQSDILNRRIEITALRRSGEGFPVELSILPFKVGDKRMFTAFVSDISERKRSEQALLESEKKFRLIAENTSDGITIFDKHQHVQYVSPAVMKQLGYTEQNELSRASAEVYALIDPAQRDALFASINEAIQSKMPALSYAYRIKHKSGHYIWREDSTNFRYTSTGEYDGAYVVSRDITERKRMEEEVRQLAYFDPLTHLPNRRMLNDRLNQAMAQSKRSGHCAAIMIMDLDNFKPLNDAHGHMVGDLLLIEVASRLRACVREVDTVARFGGDEFVVVLSELDAAPEISLTQALAVAEKIRAALAVPYVLSVQKQGQPSVSVVHRCSASIGVTLFMHDDTSAEDVLKKADSAMYQAKEQGRNRVWLSQA